MKVTFAKVMLSDKELLVLVVCTMMTFLFSLFFSTERCFLVNIRDAASIRSPRNPLELSLDVRRLMARRVSLALCPPIAFPDKQNMSKSLQQKNFPHLTTSGFESEISFLANDPQHP